MADKLYLHMDDTDIDHEFDGVITPEIQKELDIIDAEIKEKYSYLFESDET
ncbi:MAG: hypothetical protein K6E27_04720 [Eubacterium sp.]|nr:hypothetical protein [Eubacterium sp.]